MRTLLGHGSQTGVAKLGESDPHLSNTTIAMRIHKEVLNSRNRPYKFTTNAVSCASHAIAIFLAGVPAVLYLGLSEDDFKSGAQRYVFAGASFLLNYVQVLTVQQKTLERYFSYGKEFVLAIIHGGRGIRELLQIQEEFRMRSKIYATVKSIFGFLFREGCKWTILIYASMLPPSLAKEVPWLNNKIYKEILRVAIIIFLQEAVHERIENFKLPAIMPIDILRGEISEFRNVISSLLKFNQYDIMDNRNSHNTKILETNETQGLFTRALNVSRHCDHFDFFSSNSSFYIGGLITLILASLYSAANAGNYAETYSNLADPIEGRIGSILVDFLFGLYMAIETGAALGFHLRRMKAIVRNHKWELGCCVLAIAISSLTVGSTLAVAKDQNMPLFIKILTIPGTIFDNTNFLVLLLFSIAAQCRRSNERVILANFYERFRSELESLNHSEFMEYITDVSHEGDFLKEYKYYIYQHMPWTKNLSIQKILEILNAAPQDALKDINRNGRFGLLRRTEELSASLLAMSICLLKLIPGNCKNVRVIFEYACPVASIPVGIMAIGLFSQYHSHHKERESDCESNRKLSQTLKATSDAVTIKKPTNSCSLSRIVSATVKSALVLTLPLAVKWGAQLTSHWIYTHIFKQSPEQAERSSEYTATAVTALSSFVVTKSIAVGMR